jgi:hypothetical protein
MNPSMQPTKPMRAYARFIAGAAPLVALASAIGKHNGRDRADEAEACA